MNEIERCLVGPAWEVAPTLLGWVLESDVGGERTSVTLTEVEAYDQSDAASHSHRGETQRTRTMFGMPGRLYVYRSYGIHWCVNVSTGPVGHGAAVLLRGGEPRRGEAAMSRRRGRMDHLADGPGKLAQSLGLEGGHDGLDLTGDGLVRLRPGAAEHSFSVTSRIGITRAIERPWRFVAAGASSAAR